MSELLRWSGSTPSDWRRTHRHAHRRSADAGQVVQVYRAVNRPEELLEKGRKAFVAVTWAKRLLYPS